MSELNRLIQKIRCDIISVKRQVSSDPRERAETQFPPLYIGIYLLGRSKSPLLGIGVWAILSFSFTSCIFTLPVLERCQHILGIPQFTGMAHGLERGSDLSRGIRWSLTQSGFKSHVLLLGLFL